MRGVDFDDPTNVTIVVHTDVGALAALKDHPSLLSPPDGPFVCAVHRGVEHLRAARVVTGDEIGETDRA